MHFGPLPLLLRLSLPGGPSAGPSPVLSSLQRLAVHVSKVVDKVLEAEVRMDALRQLTALAPHAGRLTVLTLSGVGVLVRRRAPELARILLMLPRLQDLEVRPPIGLSWCSSKFGLVHMQLVTRVSILV